MQAERDTMVRGVPRAAFLALASLAFAVFMTWPLASGLGSLGRTGVTNDPRFGTNGDGMFCLWNVSWVAHAVVADPLNLFDANIFHPHKKSLAYSGGQPGRRRSRRAGLVDDEKPLHDPERRDPRRVRDGVAVHVDAGAPSYRQWRRRNGRRHSVRVLPVRLRSHGAHSIDADRRDTTGDADAP